MKHSEILREIKEIYLWGGSYDIDNEKCRYICHALNNFNRETHFEHNEIVLGIKRFIANQLSCLGTYDNWLEIFHTELYITMSNKDIQDGRKQWIDWMIQQYEEQGK